MLEPVDCNFSGQKEGVGNRENDCHERAVKKEEMNPENVSGDNSSSELWWKDQENVKQADTVAGIDWKDGLKKNKNILDFKCYIQNYKITIKCDKM